MMQDETNTAPERPLERFVRCPGCGNEIDPEVCWCGDYIKEHGCSSGHSAVPMGCDCHRMKAEDNEVKL